MSVGIGFAESAVGKLPGRSTMSLATEVAIAAVHDAGIELSALDGIVTSPPMVGGAARHSMAIAEELGILPNIRYTESHTLGGASSLVGFLRAYDLVQRGVNRAILVVLSDTPRTGQARSDSVAAFAAIRHPHWEQPYGMSNVSAYALLAERYLHDYGLGREALASIPVAMRKYAQTHPGAVYRDELTVDEVLDSRMIASPLHLLECSPISDGAAAVVLHSLDPEGQQVELLGSGQGYRYDSVSFGRDLGWSGVSLSAPRAFDDAGLTPPDIDVAMIYDSYSIALALQIEQLGFFAPGTSPAAIAAGAVGIDGLIPTNPHGGLLSHSHCGGAAGIHHLVEGLKQLRGTAANQVENAETALIHAEGGIISANVTAILRRA